MPLSRSQAFAFLLPTAAVVFIGIAIIAAYSNCTANAFALDDWHTIQQNPAIRQLDWAHLKRFFTDLNAFSVLPANLDYRPALLVTYAANYQWSLHQFGDGYDPRTWHWVNMFLHWSACSGLFFVGRALIGAGRLSPLPRTSHREGDLLAFAATVLFAIHPITSGCVNYISARSSLMVAALLLPAMAMYLWVLARGLPTWTLAAPLLLSVIAMFTKVEAVAFLPVLAAAEFLFAPGNAGVPLWRRPFTIPTTLRIAPFAVLTAVYYVFIWGRISNLFQNAHRAASGMPPSVYLLTEVRAWWYYIAEILAPVHLVADESAYPISGGIATAEQLRNGEPLYSAQRALLDARVWLAVAGWLGVAAASLRAVRSFPLMPFVWAAFLLFLAPTSSVVPLAEMVNEHRPYLPAAGLFILGACGMFALLRTLSPRPMLAFAAAALLLAIPLLGLTRARNRVWTSDLTLWRDTAEKTPSSSRAQMNYGLALMSRSRYPEAEARFRQAVTLAPYWTLAHTNLAIVLAAEGNTAAATTEHDAAVRVQLDANGNPTDSTPYYWRGLFRARQGDLPHAIEDFQQAVSLNPSAFKELAALAESLIQVGRNAEAEPLIQRGNALDAPGFERERQSFRSFYLRSAK